MEPMLKSQTVRIADVFFIGPAMIWAAYSLSQKQPVFAAIMGLLGGATIGYNARNYFRYRQLAAVTPAPPQQPPPPHSAGTWT